MTKPKWVICPYCGHKLFKQMTGESVLDVKCPSCKRIYVLKGGEKDDEQASLDNMQ